MPVLAILLTFLCGELPDAKQGLALKYHVNTPAREPLQSSGSCGPIQGYFYLERWPRCLQDRAGSQGLGRFGLWRDAREEIKDGRFLESFALHMEMSLSITKGGGVVSDGTAQSTEHGDTTGDSSK